MLKKIVSERWEKISCILCGSGSETQVFWQDLRRGHIVRCNQCGLTYRSPRHPEEDLTDYFKKVWKAPLVHEKARIIILKKIVKWILKRHSLPGAILDIGTGSGSLLALFPKTWNRFGVEPSKADALAAQKRLPDAQIINATVGSMGSPGNFFDVITIMGTIYYLPQPLDDLAKIRSLLNSSGMVLIESPNFTNRGYIYRWMNHKFARAQVYFYTPTTLRKVIVKAGMQVVDRIDLPGHRFSSKSYLERIISWTEFFAAILVRRISLGRIDIVPRFLLVARPC